MIRYFQRLKAKRGFTMIELIIVIAVIGILAAMILPSLDTKKAKIEEACSYSRDLYNALQTVFTKYSLTEAPLSLGLKSDGNTAETDNTKDYDEFIRFYKKAGGNFPCEKGKITVGDMPKDCSLFMEISVKAGSIDNINFGNALKEVIGVTTPTDTKTEEVLKSDVESRMELRDGYYYAEVRYTAPPTVGGKPALYTNPVKVCFTSYCQNQLTGYDTNFLKFKSHCVNYNGQVVGVFAPYKSDKSKTMGDADSILGNDDPTDDVLPA